MTQKKMVLYAIAAVALLLIYTWWTTRPRHVTDPADDPEASALFDRLNPQLVRTPRVPS